jgi:hypothetical protein
MIGTYGNAHDISTRKLEYGTHFVGHTYRRKGNIKMELIEIGCESTDVICLTQVMDLWRAIVTLAKYRAP